MEDLSPPDHHGPTSEEWVPRQSRLRGKKRRHSTFSESLWSIPRYACLTRAFIGRVLRGHRESLDFSSLSFSLSIPPVGGGDQVFSKLRALTEHRPYSVNPIGSCVRGQRA